MGQTEKNLTLELSFSLRHPGWHHKRPSLKRWAQKAIAATLQHEGIHGECELSMLCSDDRVLQQLNHEYRSKNKPTNVLSFSSGEDDFLGDIAVSLDALAREAKEQEKSLKDHFIHLTVHSTLHLLGYDHMDPKETKAMEAIEVDILQSLGIDNPYLL